MTTPALQDHKPRELTDVLIADRERLRKWLQRIQHLAGTDAGVSWKMMEHIRNACALALQGEAPP